MNLINIVFKSHSFYTFLIYTVEDGKPDESIFIMGDYDKGYYHMKGKEPIICKKFTSR